MPSRGRDMENDHWHLDCLLLSICSLSMITTKNDDYLSKDHSLVDLMKDIYLSIYSTNYDDNIEHNGVPIP